MNTKKQKQHKLFYGWIVCAMCLLLMFVSMGLTSNMQSVFLPYFIKEYGLTNSQASSLVTIRCFIAFVSLFLIGKYYKVLGYRVGTAIAAFSCALAHLIYGISTAYWQFCIASAIAGISYGIGTMVPISILMNRWFYKHRALTIGICSTGSVIATVILPAILTKIIETRSLSASLMFIAAISTVISILIFIFIADRPSDKNLEPYGIEDTKGSEDEPEKKKEVKAAQTDDLTKACITLLIIISVFMGAVASPGFVHLAVLFTSEGFDPMYVAFLISFISGLLAIFKIVYGFFTDRVGGFWSSTLFMAVLITGHVFCCFAFTGSSIIALSSALFLGIGYPVSTVGLPIWAGDLSSEEKYPDTVRKLQIGYAGGAMLFASIPGIMADRFGSYISSYIMFTAIMLLSMALLIFVYKRNRKKVPE